MDEPALVTVIMIFYNSERFMREAIESVFSQTYNKWELLLIDDGSTDSSTRIAWEYAIKFPDKIRYLQHDGHANLGKSASHNLGLRNATGNYIAFLDSDDLYLPHKLESQVSLLQSRPESGMVYGRAIFWHSWSEEQREIGIDCYTKIGLQPNTLYQPPALLLNLLQDEDIHPANCSTLIRRSALAQVGGFEEQFRIMYEDSALLAKLFLSIPVFLTEDTVALYRQHLASTCHRAAELGSYNEEEPNHDRAAFLNWLHGHLRKQGIVRTPLNRRLYAELWPYRHPKLYHAMGFMGSKKKRRKAIREFIHHILPKQFIKQLQKLRGNP